MVRRPPGPTRTDTRLPYPTLLRSVLVGNRKAEALVDGPAVADIGPFEFEAPGRLRHRAGGAQLTQRKGVDRFVRYQPLDAQHRRSGRPGAAARAGKHQKQPRRGAAHVTTTTRTPGVTPVRRPQCMKLHSYSRTTK